jgi:TolB protein
MTRTLPLTGALAVAVLALWVHAQQPPPTTPPQPPPVPQQPRQPDEVVTTITGEGGAPPRLAVPDFIPLTPDAETATIARTIGQVLWDDLNFEREYAFIPRDVYSSIPRATSFADVPFDRWRELNADGLVVGTVQKTTGGIKVEMRLYNVRGRQMVYGKEYSGSGANPRLYAHKISDDIHESQRALHGVAQTRLTFTSDRDGERVTGTVEKRDVKEIYVSDYDGERQQRVTVGRTLNAFPRWSPDGRSIAYTSWRRGGANIFISNIYQATMEEVTKGNEESWLAAWSPDGARLCFASPREGKGHTNLYIINRDGSNLRKLTNHPSINTSPTWSPSGTQIAFSSDRTGPPKIYVIAADGVGQPQSITPSESYADKATWSPAPYNEIAYTAKTGPGNDIKVIDMATRQVRQLTFGEGTNESPAYAPNGRHIAFWSTRSGKKQIFTIARTGQDLRQITRTGNNEQPDWSRPSAER